MCYKLKVTINVNGILKSVMMDFKPSPALTSFENLDKAILDFTTWANKEFGKGKWSTSLCDYVLEHYNYHIDVEGNPVDSSNK